jgi:hypothetical protein
MLLMFRSRITRLAVLFAGLPILCAVALVAPEHTGIRVIVRNLSGTALRHVSLKVENRGKRYGLPDLAPGDQREIVVEPITECHINLEFVDTRGKSHTATVIGYAEHGYCGQATVTVLPANKVEAKENMNEYCW